MQHRLGIIGAGDVVRRFHLPALTARSRIRVTGICSAQGTSAKDLAKTHSLPFAGTGYLDLLERPDVESVLICTPPHTHIEIARAALERRKHVLIEKPICASHKDLKKLLDVASRSSPVLYYTYNNRLREENQWLAARVSDGEIGALDMIEVEWLRRKDAADKPWVRDAALSGGGVLADLGSHLIMIALGLVPERRRFAAFCANICREPRKSPVEDVATATIKIDGAVSIALKAGWGMKMDHAVRVNITAYDAQGSVCNRDFEGARTDGYGHVIDAFLNHIETGSRPPLGLVEDTSMLLHALYRSNRGNKVVSGAFRGGP